MDLSPSGALVEATRRAMSGPHGITDNAVLHDVTATPEGLLVTFRWGQDQTVCAYLADATDTTTSPWTGLTVETLDDWAADLSGFLMEELDTGGVNHAPRLPYSGYVLLDFAARWQNTYDGDDPERRPGRAARLLRKARRRRPESISFILWGHQR